MSTKERQARSYIKNDNPIIYDVAANYGQLVDNVKHTDWFLQAVIEWIS